MTPLDPVEANVYAYPLFHPWSRAEGYDGPELLWTLSAIPAAYFNRIGRASLTGDEADAKIAAILERARAKNVSVTWWVGPSSRPADLGRRLSTHGFKHTVENPGMAMGLDGELPPAPASLRIERVDDPERLRVWNDLPGYSQQRYAFYVEHLGPSFVHYLGYVDGRPIGTSSLFLGGGAAGIYSMFTLEELRGRGFGAALAHVAMRDARALGHREIVLLARPSATLFYKRLGFVERCRFNSYVWER